MIFSNNLKSQHRWISNNFKQFFKGQFRDYVVGNPLLESLGYLIKVYYFHSEAIISL